MMDRRLETIKTIKFVPQNLTQNAIKNFIPYNKESIVGDVKGFEKILRRFIPPKVPENEHLRLATLHSLNILDTLPEERFDRITKMVQAEFDVPIVFVSLVDMDRQWLKSKQSLYPLPEGDMPREITFCGHTILTNETFVVENTLDDDRFAENPVVEGETGVRFYAGVPLGIPSEEGTTVNIGTLCILDMKPRKLSQEQLEKLNSYGNRVQKEVVRRDSETGYSSSEFSE